VTFKATPSLNNKHVVFGRLVEGMSVLDAMEATPTGARDRPARDIRVTDCGIVAEQASVKAEPRAEAGATAKSVAAAAPATAAANEVAAKPAQKEDAAATAASEYVPIR
jgi:hypothetical protein